MSCYARGKFWWCEFQVGGERHRRSTKVSTSQSKRTAEKVERTLRAKVEGDARRRTLREYSLSEACSIWLRERGALLAENAPLMEEHLLQTAALFDGDPLISTLDGAAVSAALTKRRAMKDRRRRKIGGDSSPKAVSEATVQRDTIAVLRRVLNYMRDVHNAEIPHIKWGLLTTGAPRTKAGREIEPDEAQALFTRGLREDYADFHEFLLLAGVRKRQALLRWPDWSATRQAVRILRLKKRPGAQAEYKWHPVGPRAASLIEAQRGRHEEFIWTYVGQTDGMRRPITYEGLKSEWRRKRRQNAAKGLRLHDLRHSAGSAIVRETGSLELARERLDHASIRTTSAFYSHLLDKDARDAAEAAERALKVTRRAPTEVETESPHKSPHTGSARKKRKA